MDLSSVSSNGLDGAGLDCSIYIDSENYEVIRRYVARSLGATSETRDKIMSSAATAYIAHNDYEADSDDESDFVTWATVLECEQSGSSAEAFVNAISGVLVTLWEAGIRAVAACGFEDRLPHSGGIGLFS